MPRPGPPRRLIRDALGASAAACLLIGASAWWAWRDPAPRPAPAAQLAEHTAQPTAAPRPANRSNARLWRPFSDVPVQAPAQPQQAAPSARLISLSRRDDRWTGLVDPGDGSAAQRVIGGERILGWQVESVDQDGVLLVEGDRRHRLQMGR